MNIVVEYGKHNNIENTIFKTTGLVNKCMPQSIKTKEENIKPSLNTIFEIKILGGKIYARAIYENGKMTVLKGSTFSQGFVIQLS